VPNNQRQHRTSHAPKDVLPVCGPSRDGPASDAKKKWSVFRTPTSRPRRPSLGTCTCRTTRPARESAAVTFRPEVIYVDLGYWAISGPFRYGPRTVFCYNSLPVRALMAKTATCIQLFLWHLSACQISLPIRARASLDMRIEGGGGFWVLVGGWRAVLQQDLGTRVEV